MKLDMTGGGDPRRSPIGRCLVVAPAAVSALVLISPPPVVLDDPSPAVDAAWEAEGAALEHGDCRWRGMP